MRRVGQLARQALELELGLRAVERVGDGRIEREQLAVILREAAEHEALLAHDLAAVGPQVAGEQSQQRGLAAAVRADDRELRALVHRRP